MSLFPLKTLYVRGVNSMGQLGLQNKYTSVSTFTAIPSLTSMPIKSLYASWAQSACLLSDNTFLIWGWPLDVRSQMQALWTLQDNTRLFKFIQRYSPLPWISYREGKDFPDPILLPEDICNLDIGGGYVLCCAENGHTFGFGENHRGQLGLRHARYQLTPLVVSELLTHKIVQVAAGYQHSLFLSADGIAYGVGRSTYSALGSVPLALIQPLEYIDTVVEIKISNVHKVAAGSNFSIFLDKQGEVFAVGKNEYGQCAQPNIYPTIEDPVPVYLPEKITDIACGNKHTLALGESGKLYAWGSKQNGQIDGFRNGIYSEQCSPVEVEIPIERKVKKIRAGHDRSCAFLETGEVFLWGGTDFSALDGEFYQGFYLLNPDLPHLEIEDVGLGFMHTLVLTQAQ